MGNARVGGRGVRACLVGLEHFFSTSKRAISCFRMYARMVGALLSSFWKCQKTDEKGSEKVLHNAERGGGGSKAIGAIPMETTHLKKGLP